MPGLTFTTIHGQVIVFCVFTGKRRAPLPYHPLAARNEGQQLGRGVAADEGADGYGRNGGHGGQGEVLLEDTHPQAEPQQVHEVHAVAQFRQVGDEAARTVNAGEQEEGSCGEGHAVDGAEAPANLQHGRHMIHSRHGLHPERPDGGGGTHGHEREADDDTLAAAPVQMHTDVVGKDEIAQIAGEVPQHVVIVPEALSPHLAAPAVEVGHAGGHEEEADEEPLLPCRGLLQPWRDEGDEEVEAEERIHEPQVSGHRREVERQAQQVGERLIHGQLSPQQGQGAVKNHEHEEGWQDSRGTLAVELPHGLPLPHGREQIGGHDDEQWHRHSREPVVERHPQTVVLGAQQRLRPCEVALGSVEVLTGVDEHHEEAGEHAYIVKEYDSLLFHLSLIISVCFHEIETTGLKALR